MENREHPETTREYPDLQVSTVKVTAAIGEPINDCTIIRVSTLFDGKEMYQDAMSATEDNQQLIDGCICTLNDMVAEETKVNIVKAMALAGAKETPMGSELFTALDSNNTTFEPTYTFYNDRGLGPVEEVLLESELKDNHLKLMLGELLNKYNGMPDVVKEDFIKRIAE